MERIQDSYGANSRIGKRRANPENVSVINRRILTAIAAAVMILAAPSLAEHGCSKSVAIYDAWWCLYGRQVGAIIVDGVDEARIIQLCRG